MKFVIAAAFQPLGHLAPLARVADECSFEALAFSDHVVYPEKLDTPYPYTPDGSRRYDESSPFPDPWVAIGALAAVTTRLRFTTNVFVLPMRNLFAAAKAIATAAVLSNDRVTLTVGVGWSRIEFELLGQDFATRGRRTDEMLAVLPELWSGRMVEHHGRFYDFGPLNMRPAVERPIPIVVGGTTEAAYRRVGRIGDGWMPHALTLAEAKAGLERIRHWRREAGRAEAPLSAVVPLMDVFDPDGYRRAEEAGITHVLTAPWLLYGGSHRSLPDKRDGLRRFADTVIAKLG
jgi:probable F420-dependent oxidoreductase